MQMGCLFCEPQQKVDRKLIFRARFGQGLAAFKRHDAHKGLFAFRHQAMRPVQQICACPRGYFAPGALCSRCSVKSAQGIRRACVGHRRHHRTIGWIFHVKLIGAADPCAVNVEARIRDQRAQSVGIGLFWMVSHGRFLVKAVSHPQARCCAYIRITVISPIAVIPYYQNTEIARV